MRFSPMLLSDCRIERSSAKRAGAACKPSHKPSAYGLQAGLSRADSGSMDLLKDVINRPTMPTDPEGKFAMITSGIGFRWL